MSPGAMMISPTLRPGFRLSYWRRRNKRSCWSTRSQYLSVQTSMKQMDSSPTGKKWKSPDFAFRGGKFTGRHGTLPLCGSESCSGRCRSREKPCSAQNDATHCTWEPCHI
jgi:hypothetical protein